MVVRRRLTSDKRIVCHFDESLALIGNEKLKRYVETLDIDVLGDIGAMEEPPTVFTVKPLTPEGEDLSFNMNADNVWRIFATHVKNVSGWPIEFNEGVIDYKHREEFTPETVQNIASIIVELSNRGNSNVFFTPPVGAVRFWDATRKHHASQTMADKMKSVAGLADAQPNQQKSETRKLKEVGATGTDGVKST